MSIIEQIYESHLDEERQSTSIFKLDNQINALLQQNGYSTDSELSNLFFEVSGCGQLYGFQSGFRTAVALMMECLA